MKMKMKMKENENERKNIIENINDVTKKNLKLENYR